MNDKAQLIYTNITTSCNNLTIAKYIKNEIKQSLLHLNEYKLENIRQCLPAFLEFVNELNENNTNTIQSLSSKAQGKKKKKLNNSVLYYCCYQNITADEEKEIGKKIQANIADVVTNINVIKGVLLLSIDEFCNGSQTRMSINTMLKKTKHSKQNYNKISLQA
ncbi:hypothetical protein AGMMS50249_4860 [candidate division SR1 bacterium]|nr:hypothetical protein AGMMS50249_4860 [candidate division SR1 bacterium]